MKTIRLAPLVGIGGCVLVLVALALPYSLVATSPGTAIGTYYGTGAVNPLVAGLFALVSVIVLAAGREGRTDPGLAAGVALALGAFITLLIALWAATVPQNVVFDMDAPAVIQHHRWATAAVSLLVPAASLWWARSLDLV